MSDLSAGPSIDDAVALDVRDGQVRDSTLEIQLKGGAHPEGPGLQFLGGDFDHESWVGSEADLRAIVLGADDSPDSDAAVPAERLYRELIEELRDSSHPYPLRFWNFFPAINAGEGDDERYRRFCVGRGRALEAAGLADARMCAATAIGGDRPVMQLVALVARRPGISIENPRQVSSWNYPRRYGPRQPAFARATGIPLADGRTGLLISGTASVVGHATAHADDVLAQTDEAASNLEALLRNGATTLDRPELGRFSSDALARVYVRHESDWPRVEAQLRKRWPALKLCGLRGDVCRSNLLVEIEAWQVA